MLTNQRFDETPVILGIDETARTMVLAQGAELLLLHHKDTATHKRLRLEGRIIDVAVSENGEHVAATTSSNLLHYFDRELNELWTADFPQRPTALCVSPRGHFIGVGTNDKKVHLLDNKNYYRRTLEGVRKAIDEAKQSGMVVLEAEILGQKAEQELEAEAFSSALKYAEAAVKIVSRQRERAKPQVSVLGVVHEAFRVGKPNTIRSIVMNTGMAPAKNISFRFEGEVRTDAASAREFLSVGGWYEDNWEVVPLKKGDSVVRFRCMWHDSSDQIQMAESQVPISAVESDKPLLYKKSAPFVQVGNVNKLVARVQADKTAGKVPLPPVTAGGHKSAEAAAQGAQTLRCKKCDSLLQEDWYACPKCGTAVE